MLGIGCHCGQASSQRPFERVLVFAPCQYTSITWLNNAERVSVVWACLFSFFLSALKCTCFIYPVSLVWLSGFVIFPFLDLLSL